MAGLCVAGGFIVTGAAGVDVENTVTYQTFVVLFGMLIFAFVSSRFFRGTFSATRFLPRFGTVGQPLHYRLLVKNLTAQTQSGLTLLENPDDPRPPFQEWLAFQLAENKRLRPFRVSERRRTNPFRLVSLTEAEVPPLLPKAETEVRIEILPLRRGILRFVQRSVGALYALGLFRLFVKALAKQSLLILPKRFSIPPIALPGTMKYQEGGVALAANVGRSDEFVSLRDYRHGDPVRHIHWRSWAKVGKPVVKEFEDEFCAPRARARHVHRRTA